MKKENLTKEEKELIKELSQAVKRIKQGKYLTEKEFFNRSKLIR